MVDPKFVEQNWALGHISGSFANVAGSLRSLFDFGPGGGDTPALYLDPATGQPSLTPPAIQR